VAAIAHEVRQPLMAIAINGSAARRFPSRQRSVRIARTESTAFSESLDAVPCHWMQRPMTLLPLGQLRAAGLTEPVGGLGPAIHRPISLARRRHPTGGPLGDPQATVSSNRSLRCGETKFSGQRQRGRNGLGDPRTPVQRQNLVRQVRQFEANRRGSGKSPLDRECVVGQGGLELSN